MADAEQKLRIVTEYEDRGVSDNLKKSQAQIISFADAVEKSGKKVSKSFDEQQKKGSDSAKSLSSSFNSLKASTLGAFAAVAGGVAIIGKIVTEIEQAEVASKKLSFAFKSSGITSQEAVNKYKNFAKAIQSTTTVSDEAVLSLGTFLTSAGVGFDQLEKASKAAVEYSARFGTSLEESGSMIAKMYSGTAREVGKLVPEIGLLTEAQLRAGQGVDILISKFGGSAANERGTLAGSLQVLKNSLGELAESFAVVFGPSIQAASELAKGLASWLEKITDSMANISSGAGGTRLEQFQAQLKDVDAYLNKMRSGADSGHASKADELYYESQIRIFTKERNDLMKSIAGLQANSTKEIAAQVETSKKLRADNEANIVFLDKQKGLLGELKSFDDDLFKKQGGPIDQINAENELRKRKIEEFYKFKVDLDGKYFKNYQRRLSESENIKKAQTKKYLDEQLDSELERIKKESDAQKNQRLSNIKGFGDKLEILSTAAKDPLSAIGAAIGGSYGGPEGAAIGSKIPQMLNDLSKSLPTILQDTTKQLGELLSNVGKGVVGYLKSWYTGSWFTSLFDDPKFYASFGDAVAEKMDKSEFVRAIQRLVEGIKSAADSFRSVADRLKNAQAGLSYSESARGKSLDAVFKQIGFQSSDFGYKQQAIANGNGTQTVQTGFQGTLQKALAQGVSTEGGKFRIKDAKKFAEAVDSLGSQLQDEATRIVEIANLKIEKFADKMEKLSESLSRLTSERSGVAATFKGAIDFVGGALRSPEQTVSMLRNQFNSARGEKRGLLGGQLAGALQGQFQAAQNLASQGGITGEELAKIQADILSQLESTQTESLSEFDRLIKANETQAATLQKKIDELKAAATKQVDKLSQILEAIKTGNFGAIPKYANGTDYVPKTGLALVHQGERIVSPQSRMNGGGGITININGVSASGSTKQEIVRVVQDALRSNLGGLRAQIGKING